MKLESGVHIRTFSLTSKMSRTTNCVRRLHHIIAFRLSTCVVRVESDTTKHVDTRRHTNRTDQPTTTHALTTYGVGRLVRAVCVPLCAFVYPRVCLTKKGPHTLRWFMQMRVERKTSEDWVKRCMTLDVDRTRQRMLNVQTWWDYVKNDME